MFRINALKFYYKYQHRKLPNYFYNFNLTTQGSRHSYDTRSGEQIRTDRTRAEFCDNRIRIFLPKVINSTPANLLQKIGTHSLQGFSSNIKRYILDEFTEIFLWLIVTFVNGPEKKTFNHLPLAFSTLN